MQYYLFGYGSIMSPKSASAGLKRLLVKEDFIHADLHGYVRSWTAAEALLFERVQREATGVFLNLTEKEGVAANGVLLAVSHLELEQMKKREKNYDCIDVTARIEAPLHGEATVVTFVTPPDRQAEAGMQNAYIPARYLDILHDAFATWGEAFEARYALTTEPMGFALMEGEYRFCDPAQQAYA